MATSYPVPRRLFAMAARVETTYAADKVPTFVTAGHAVRLLDRPTVTHEFLSPNTRENWFTGGLGELAAINPSGQAMEIDFSCPIHGTGAAYSSTAAPNVDPFLRAAGFAAAYTTASVAYTFSDGPATGLSVYTRMDGKQYYAVGCVVTEWSIVGNAGEYYEFRGKLRGIAKSTAITETDIGTITLPSTVPPLFKGATCVISAYTPVVRSFELNGGIQYATRGDGNAALGHAGFRITRRQPEFRPVVEHADISNYNPEADWFAATQRSLDFNQANAAKNQFEITAADMRVIGFADGDDGGLTTVSPIYRIFTPSSGVELQIKFL